MPRYEFVEGSSSKFWEITLDGTSFTTTYGRIGTDGQSTTKDWPSEAEAKKQYEKLIAEKTKKGYELVDDDEDEGGGGGSDDDDEDSDDEGSPGARNPSLEKAINANPESPDAYLVYGDWLQGQRDPLGEFITVTTNFKSDPSNAKLKQRVGELLAKHEDGWLGETLSELKSDGELTLTWGFGFLERLAVGGDEYSEHPAVDAYEAIAKCRVAQFLRELEINVFECDDGQPNYDEVLDAMVENPLPKTLRSLAFDVKSYQISWTELGDLSKLYPQLQKLESLRIKMGNMNLGKRVDLPNLKKLEIVTGGLRRDTLKAVTNTRWEKLDTLVLFFGDDNYGGDCTIADVEPILQAKNLSKVKHLGLCNSTFTGPLISALLTSKVLPQLETLDLSHGTLGDEEATAILENKKAFDHLKRLDLSKSWISDAMTDSLAKAFGDKVLLEDQDSGEDPEDRYVRISE